MSIEFFKLPAALKKAIWAAYLAEWKKKQAAKKPAPDVLRKAEREAKAAFLAVPETDRKGQAAALDLSLIHISTLRIWTSPMASMISRWKGALSVFQRPCAADASADKRR